MKDKSKFELTSKKGVFKMKRKRASSKGNMDHEGSDMKDSTIFGTSKYLNHTQLKNESESLSMLNSRAKKNGIFHRKYSGSKLMEELIEEESKEGLTVDEIEEDQEVRRSAQKRERQSQSVKKGGENADIDELDEHPSPNELVDKMNKLHNSM
jgi:hypothetical protein